MSTETNSTESAAAAQVGSPEQLGAAREARGWSLSDAASKLGMMPRQIDAIEHGRWEALPGHAFVRGAIRAYGKALQVDVAPLLATLGAQSTAPELRPSASLEAPLPRRGALGFDNGGSGSRLTWILLGLLGVAAIAMYFGRGADLGRVLDADQPGRAVETVPVQPLGSPGGAVEPAAADRAPAAVSSAPGSTTTPGAASTEAASPSPVDGQGGRPDPAAPVSNEPVGATPAAAAPPPPAQDDRATGSGGAATPADASADALVFRFERESWVEVRDATGRVLLVGTQPAQSTRQVAGRKPYSITVGNAPHVRLEHAGRNVDLSGATQRGVARMKIE